MERAISFITVMPDSQAGVKLFIEKVLSEVEIREALPLLAKLTAMEKIIEGVREGLKDQILDEASLTAEKVFTINGTRYEKRTKTTNHYHNCQLHEELKARLKKLEDVMKVIEAPIADTDTGEIIPPALKSYTDYIAVSLRKE
jgi:FMN-dependent NADH-azoreductase